MENFWVAALWSILPTLVVGGIFWYVLRSVIRSDRNERRAYAKIEAEERAKMGLPPKAAPAAEASIAPDDAPATTGADR